MYGNLLETYYKMKVTIYRRKDQLNERKIEQ